MEASMSPQQLPIESHRLAILQHLRYHRVTFIQGETGCGKSSMVPQFILYDVPTARIFVTQPRRFAAKSLARRVGEQLGNAQLVGYRLGRGERSESPETRITFCTTGYLVQLLSFNPSALKDVTHVLLDEVHERTMDADMLLLLMKFSLRVYPHLKLVIMSATLQPQLFCNYFADIHAELRPLVVGAKRFPVTSVFLDQLHRLPGGAAAVQRSSGYDEALRSISADNPKLSRPMEGVVLAMVEALAEPDTCVLVFLPGAGEIDAIQMGLQRVRARCPLQVLPLLAMIPAEEQDRVLQPARPGHCKVVLATNVAESSVTIPAVQYVVDSGLRRGVFTDPRTGQPALVTQWVSRASAKQRAGRAGRLGPGTVVHLYTEEFHAHRMREFDDAEMEHAALETTVLSTKLLFSRFGTVRDVLGMTISPPPSTRVDLAFRMLERWAALTLPDEQGAITAIGRLAVHLRLELPLVRLLFFGHSLGLLLEAIVVAACCAQGDLFSMPSRLFIRDPARFLNALSRNFMDRVKADGGRYSEPLANYTAFVEWLLGKRDGGLSLSRARAATLMAVDLCDTLLREALLPLTAEVGARLRSFQDLAAGRVAPEAGLDLFPERDPYLLYFLIGAACAPTFLQAREAPNNPGRRAQVQGLDPNRTVVLRGLPPEVMSSAQLTALLEATAFKVAQAEILDGDDPRFVDGLVELVRRDPDRPEGDSEARVLRDLDVGVKLLHQWYVQNNDTLALLDLRGGGGRYLGVRDDRGSAALAIRALDYPNALEWAVFGAGLDAPQTAKFNSRSPLALTADRDCDTALWVPPVAVAFSTIGMPASGRVYASGTTIMPLPAFGALLMLVFARTVDQVQVLQTDVGKTGPGAFLIAAARFSCFGDGTAQTASFAPFLLDHTHLAQVNALRELGSRVVRGDAAAAAAILPAVSALLESVYWSRDPTEEEFLEETDTWPWLDVDCSPAGDDFECTPRLVIKPDLRAALLKESPGLARDVKKMDAYWHNTYREFRMLTKLYLDRNENRLDLSTIANTFSLSGRKAKAKLKRLGFLTLRDLFETMPDLVRVVGGDRASNAPWYLEGVQPHTPPDMLDLSTQKLPYEDDKRFAMKELLLADRKAQWNGRKRVLWRSLRRKAKGAIARHPRGISLPRFIFRYKFFRPMAKSAMMNLGFADELEMLLMMPDLVHVRQLTDGSVISSEAYMLFPTAKALGRLEPSPDGSDAREPEGAEWSPRDRDDDTAPTAPAPLTTTTAVSAARACPCACHGGPSRVPGPHSRPTSTALASPCLIM